VVHQVQAQQLRGPLPARFGRAYLTLEPIWHQVGVRALGPVATLAELLSLAPPELASAVAARAARGRPRPVAALATVTHYLGPCPCHPDAAVYAAHGGNLMPELCGGVGPGG
jgi:hypothetical protein